jgi:uncharacterized damage-inducible protein DinB
MSTPDTTSTGNAAEATADVAAAGSTAKADLARYLQSARDAVLWKLDGVSEFDARRPLTPTGTNLLGLVKHLANVELGYFGATFGRPYEGPVPAAFAPGADPTADSWATADESREEVIGLYRRAWEHAGATIDALALEDTGRVPWWPEERATVTLHRVLVHMIAETHRHAGHADILREGLDGAVGMSAARSNLPEGDAAWWADYRERIERAAREAAGRD